MFPEITREDVFRLETRRLWLRWPTKGDAGEISPLFSAGPTPETAAGDPYGPDETSRTLERWRELNEAGQALYLVMTGQGPDRRAIGTIGLVPVRGSIERCGLVLRASLVEAQRGRGLMTEAVQGAVDAAFLLTDTAVIAASSRVLDPAFRRVLEKCGFAYCGTGLDGAPDRPGLVASDRFRLDRKAWTSLKTWRVPGMARGAGEDMCLA